jgi:hypothetical protein
MREFERGYGTSGPPASTATPKPPPASDPRCAAASMPSAMPLMTVIPALASPREIEWAISIPYGEGRLEPTTVTAGSAARRFSRSGFPSTKIAAGTSASCSRAGGYRSACLHTAVTLVRASARRSAPESKLSWISAALGPPPPTAATSSSSERARSARVRLSARVSRSAIRGATVATSRARRRQSSHALTPPGGRRR